LSIQIKALITQRAACLHLPRHGAVKTGRPRFAAFHCLQRTDEKCTFSKSGCKDTKFTGAMTVIGLAGMTKTEIIFTALLRQAQRPQKNKMRQKPYFYPAIIKNSD